MMSIQEAKDKARRLAIKQFGEKFVNDERGEIKAVVMVIIGVFILAILAGTLLPTALQSLTAGRNGSWAAGVLGAYDAISVIITVVVVVAEIALVYKAFD